MTGWDGTVESALKWARGLNTARGYPVIVRRCAPGDCPCPEYRWGYRDVGEGYASVEQIAVYPAHGFRDSEFDDTECVVETGELVANVWELSPVFAPTLLVISHGWTTPRAGEASAGTDGRTSYVLYVPCEPVDPRMAARRASREFAARQRDMMRCAGLSKREIKIVIATAGIRFAVSAAQLALEATAKCGGIDEAHLILRQLDSPVCDVERAVGLLAQAGVVCGTGVQEHLRREVRGALALLRARGAKSVSIGEQILAYRSTSVRRYALR